MSVLHTKKRLYNLFRFIFQDTNSIYFNRYLVIRPVKNAHQVFKHVYHKLKTIKERERQYLIYFYKNEPMIERYYLTRIKPK